MKKTLTLFVAILVTICVNAQQTFTNFQNASLVIGQDNFLSIATGRNDSVTYGPSYSAISSKGMLAVAEQTGGSVKIWYTLPTTNGQQADVEVGKPSFTATNNGPTQAYAYHFDGVAWSPDGNKLIAACGSQNRVLIWNSIPDSIGKPADVVLGQSVFTTSNSGLNDSSLNYPCGVMVSPDGKLLVAEYYNNRVLVWNSIPTSNRTPADVVIGQSNFTTNTASNLANGLNAPWGVNFSPDGKLLITCTGGNHVFIYDSIPVTNGESATVVIGHDQFGIGTSGVSDSTFYMPVAATVTPDGMVAVGDFGNSRVLIFNQLPDSSGAHADIVLGQPSFTSDVVSAPSGTTDTNNFRYVYNVSNDLNGRIFVAGRDMHRVMVFGDLPTDSADLSISITQSSASLCDSSNVVYLIKVHNPGPDTSLNVISTAAFPTGYQIENVTALDGSYTLKSGYWNIPVLAPNDSAILIIDGLVKAGMAGQTITTYANIVSSSAIDTNLTNNGTSVSVTILAITKPADPLAANTTTCYGTSAMLNASGTGTLYWYDDIDDMVPSGTGNIFNTAPLVSNSTFYVEANNGCPSINRVAVDVTINPVFSQSETVAVCSGDSYTFPDGIVQNNITGTTVHTSFLLTVNGCDSIISTTVNVNPVYNYSQSTAICSGRSYTFPDGTVQFNIINTQVHTSYLSTVNGCDSIIVTTVYVNPVYDLYETVAVCSGESYTFPDGTVQNNITVTTMHVSDLSTIYGCDSIINTTVNVNANYILSESVAVCSGESYTFPDGSVQDDITGTTAHTSNLLTVNGCDSIITTTINVNPVYNITESDAICSGESYTFPDGSVFNLIVDTIIHTSNLLTIAGCDSIITTTLYANPVFNLVENVTLCEGESYTFPDGTVQDNITSSTSHTSNLVSITGCDSIIVTTIEVTVVNTAVTQNGSTLTADASGMVYQWVNCDDNFAAIPGATNQEFTATISGNYAVIISDNGCKDTSTCFNINITVSINDIDEIQINVYPNPTYGDITIDMAGLSGQSMIEIIDLQGKKLMKNLYENEDSVQLELGNLEPGIYLLKITMFEESKIVRIVKE